MICFESMSEPPQNWRPRLIRAAYNTRGRKVIKNVSYVKATQFWLTIQGYFPAGATCPPTTLLSPQSGTLGASPIVDGGCFEGLKMGYCGAKRDFVGQQM